ncbi:MAG: hypothetical protein FJ044_01980 [Candidatus Cloacimonetes bacterium]|nr:hypothetical protein [Candidatus Cloacimonadota bacterium]
MFKDEFLFPFQKYLRQTLRLLLFTFIISFIFFSLLEGLKKGLISNTFNPNFFLFVGLISLIIIVLDSVNQGALNNRERIWVGLIAAGIGIFIGQKNITYGWGTIPLALATAIFSFFFFRALLEKQGPSSPYEPAVKTNYSQFFRRLFLLSSLLTISLPMILFVEAIRRDINPTLTYHFDFQKPHPLFVTYNPKDVHDQVLPYAKIDNEILLQFKQNQAHFTVKLPDLCEKVKIKVTFAVNEMEEVNLKLPNFDQPQPLERFPLYNLLLSQLPWTDVAKNGWRLYQHRDANKVYQSLDEFFQNPPQREKVASFVHQELPFETLPLKNEEQVAKLDYIITNYKPPIQKGFLLTNEYEGQIPQKVLEGGIGAEYKFYIEAYGQKEKSKVSIKSIDFTFLRPSVSVGSPVNFFLRRLGVK